MIPAAFDYQRPGSLEDALALMAEHAEEAKVLAGGHSLLPLMRLRLSQPSMVVDIGSIPALRYITDGGGTPGGRASGPGPSGGPGASGGPGPSGGDWIAIGAMARHSDVASSEVLRSEVPLLAYVAGQVGDPQVRHRGTIGGSLAHGDPASDLPAALLALGGSVVISGPGGEREIAADELYKGFLETAIGPDELLTEVRVPRTAGGPGPRAAGAGAGSAGGAGAGVPGAAGAAGARGWSFQKFNRRAQDWAIVGAVASVVPVGVPGSNGTSAGGRRVRVALVNMGPTPLRALAVEEAVAAGASAAEAAEEAPRGTSPSDDTAASAGFRRHLAKVMVRRALEEALG